MASARYVDTLRLLAEAGVEFVVVGPGHILLTTDNGDLDCLGTVDTDKSFEDLLPLSRMLAFDGLEIRVLDLAALIDVKRRAGRPKDLALLPVLQATLDERSREKPRS